MGKNTEVIVLSGDNDGERERLESLLPDGTQLIFNQKPDDKLEFIKKQQQSGKTVMTQQISTPQKTFDISSLTNGIYFFRLESSHTTEIHKVIKF